MGMPLKSALGQLKRVRQNLRESAGQRAELRHHCEAVFREMAELIRRSLGRRRYGDG